MWAKKGNARLILIFSTNRNCECTPTAGYRQPVVHSGLWQSIATSLVVGVLDVAVWGFDGFGLVYFWGD